jgi:arylformamidase
MAIKYIDVSNTLRHGDPGISFETARTIERNGWNASTLHLYSHAGTHMDAPVHFGVSGPAIDEIDVARFFVDCHVVDLMGIKNGAVIKVGDLGHSAIDIAPGEGLIFRTGWHKKYGTPAYREGIPTIGEELASWCAAKGVALVAVEPPSVADVNNLSLVTLIHTILLSANIIIVEGLGDLSEVTKNQVKLIALPLKTGNGDGSPCRAVILQADE